MCILQNLSEKAHRFNRGRLTKLISIVLKKAVEIPAVTKRAFTANRQKDYRRFCDLKIIKDDATKDVRDIFNETGESLLMKALHELIFPECGISSPRIEGSEKDALEAVRSASWKEVATDEKDCRAFVTSDIPGGKNSVVDIKSVPDDTLFLIEAIGLEPDYYEDVLKYGCSSSFTALRLEKRPSRRWDKRAFVLTVSDIPAVNTKEMSLCYYKYSDEFGDEHERIKLIPGLSASDSMVTVVDSKRVMGSKLKEMSVISRQQALEIGFETALVGSRANTFISYYKEKRKMSQRPSDHIYRTSLSFVDLNDRSFDEYDFSRTELTDVNMQKASLYAASFKYSVLCNVNLNGAYAKGADFTLSHLHDVEMMGTDFGRSIFDYAEITESVLRGVNLKDASLVKTKISYSDLVGVNLRGANLKKADLRDSKCFKANFKKAVLRKAKLARIDLRGANFKNADLRGADLTGAHLEGASFDGADLRGAILDGAYGLYVSFENAVMDNSSLRGVSFGFCNMKNVRLRRANLKNAELDNASMNGADLTGAMMEGISLEESFMEDTILKSVNLTGARMQMVDLKRSVMDRANLSYADISESDLSGASLVWAVLRYTCLSGTTADEANFSYAHMENTDVVCAEFRNCYFLNTRLYGVDFKHTDMEGTNTDNIDWTSWSPEDFPETKDLTAGKDAPVESESKDSTNCDVADAEEIGEDDGTAHDV